MARIELRNATIKIKDGLAGAAAVNDMSIMAGDSGMSVDAVVLNTDVTDQIPVGARFTIAGETGTPVHTVLTRTPSSGTTTSVTFSPVLAAGVMDDAVITFAPQEVTIKVGDGDVKYTEADEFIYDKDRGELDTVRRGDDVPMEVNFNFTYEHITTGTGETIAPMDAIKRRGSATEWVSSASDLCEPYAVDIEVTHAAPCGTSQDEITIFPDFRSEKREVSFKDSNIAISGKCNVTEPITSRA